MRRGFATVALLSLGCGARLGLVEPGAPIEVRLAPGEEVVLDGSGSFDPEGEELSYRWRQASGPEVELVHADTPWPRFVPNRPGRYEFELVVSAPAEGGASHVQAASEPARLVVNVLPPNRPPVVNLNEELRAEPGQWAALDGGLVTDPDGDALRFEWRQVAGEAVEMRPADGRARQVLVRSWRAGEFGFELTVRDSGGAESRARLRLIVAPNDRPPVAIAALRGREFGRPGSLAGRWGSHYCLRLTDWPHPAGGVDSRPVAAAVARTRPAGGHVEVTLDAAGSRDPDGDNIEFRWKQIAGPHVRVLYPDAEKGLASVSFDAPAEGLFRFRLVVTDGTLESAPVDVEVAVGGSPGESDGAPRATRRGPDSHVARPEATGLSADAGPDVFGEVGTEVTLSGSVDGAGERDPTRLLYDWRQVAGPRINSFRVPSMADSARPRFVPKEPGRYVLALRASEDAVRWSEPDLVTVTVLAPNRPPRVVLPTSVLARAGYPVTVVASCGDPDGDAVEVGWRGASGLVLESEGPVVTLLAPKEGCALAECVARDSRGGETRAVVRIEGSAGGRSPVASIFAPAIARPGERVVLDGSGSLDPEGDPLEFGWRGPEDLIVRLERTSRPRAVFTPDAPGRYEFVLVVAAGGRESAPARVTVEVKEGNTGAAALDVEPVRPRVTAGLPVVLHAPGARGRRVRWQEIAGPELELPPTVDGRAVLYPRRPGRYVFRLFARDDKGTREVRPVSRRVSFLCSESNARPVVTARVRRDRGAVLLDGNGSFDPDGDALDFRWHQMEGPPLNLSGDLSRFAPGTSRVRLKGVPPGRYAVRLAATDGERLARSEVVEFVVSSASPGTGGRR